jgi:hypothetical protein
VDRALSMGTMKSKNLFYCEHVVPKF